ncbi:MAG: ribbon-helix-helix domain-containing protein [Nanoarchaeota archaeon]
MAITLVTFKMEEKFLAEIDHVLKEAGFQSRTEFIRDALREKIEEIRLRESLEQLRKLRGASKRKITEEEYERAREMAFEKLSQKFK